MTSFLSPLPELPGLSDLPKPVRRAVTDSLINETRKATPAAVAEQREVKRMSVAELNAQSMDDLRQHFARTRVDTRGPVTRFLDLLDLPRNALFNLAAPGIARRKRASGETGALGLGTVRFADVLDDLGVENRIIRGVGGFLGDVAFDPLTYLGPAGWGAKAAGTGGKAVQFGRGAWGSIKAAQRGLAAGVHDAGSVGRMLAKHGIDRAALAAEGLNEKQIASWVVEHFGTPKKGPVRSVMRMAGDDLEAVGSRLVDDLYTDPNALAGFAKKRAAFSRDVVAELGRASSPGIRIGRNKAGKLGVEASMGRGEIPAGSMVAHIPFTGIGLSVPAFTAEARAGIRNLALAGVTGNAAEAVQNLSELGNLRDAIAGTTDTIKSLRAEQDAIQSERVALRKAVAANPQATIPDGRWATVRLAELDELDPVIVGKMKEAVDQSKAAVAAMQARALAVSEGYNPNISADTILRLTDTELPLAKARLEKSDAELRLALEHNADVERLSGKVGKDLTERIDEGMRAERERHGHEIADWMGRQPLDPHPTLPLEPVPEFDDMAVRQRVAAEQWAEYRAGINNAVEQHITDLVNPETLTSAKLDSRAMFADALHAQAKADALVAGHTRGAAGAAMFGRDKVIADIAAAALGLSHEVIPSGLAPMFTATDNLLKGDGRAANAMRESLVGVRNTLDAIEMGVYKRLGAGQSKLKDIERAVARQYSMMSSDAAMQVAHDYHADLLGATRDTKYSDDDARFVASVLSELPDSKLPPPGTEWWKLFDENQKRGLMDADLVARIQPITEKWAKVYHDLLGAHKESGLLRSGIESGDVRYAHHALSGPSLKDIGEVRHNLGGAEAEMHGAVANETFLQQRGTREYAVNVPVKGADGSVTMEPRTFLEGDRAYLKYTPEDVALMSKPAQEKHARVKEAVSAYDNLPLDKRTPGRVLTIPEINARADRGDFTYLLGGPVRGSFMETNPALAMAQYVHQSERARFGTWVNEFVKPFVVNVNEMKLREAKPTENGREFTTMDGMRGVFRKRADGDWVLRIGDQNYIKPNLDNSRMDLWNPYHGGFNSDQAIGYIPERLAQTMQRFTGLIKDEQQAGAVLKLAEDITKFWKATTLLHPSWTINDALGNMVLMLTMGLTPKEIGKRLADGMRVTMAHHRQNTKALEDITLDFGGRAASGADMIHAGKVQGGGSTGEMGMHLLADGTYIPDQRHKLISRDLLKDPVKHLKNVGKEWYERGVKQADASMTASELGRNKGAQVLKRGAGIVYTEGLMNRVWKPWYEMNSVVNDWLRTTAHMALMDKGYDSASAAAKVAEDMLDLGSATAFDKKLRRFVPFWMWMSRSGAFGIKQLAQNPKFFTLAPHLKRAVEEAVDGDGRLPEHMRPGWVRDQMAIQLGTDPDSRRFVLFSQMLPSEAAMQFATLAASPALGMEAFQDAVSYFGNSLGPPWKQPLEIASGKEWYTDRTISGSGDGDLSVGEYLTSQVRPLRELGVGGVRAGPLQSAFGRSALEGVARATIGGRVQPGGDERIRFSMEREYRPRVDAIRKRINLAEREGDQMESVKARARLLRLYQEMEQKGLEIPRWAARQMQEVSG